MTAAYLPFGGNGSYIEPILIEKIIQADGSTIYPGKDRKYVRVLGSKDVKQMQQMLAEVVTSGTAKTVANVPHVRGGKTGTSDENRDAWFVGYDHKNTVGVWVGNDRNESLGRTESGGRTAAPIWKSFMLSLP